MPGFDTNNVLTIMRTDTSQAEAAVKRLRGVERDRAKTALDDLNAHNDKLTDQLALFGKLAIGVGAAIGAYKLASAAAKDYLEDLRLQASAGTADLERLQKATHGLVEADNLLAFAGKTQHGIWELNQKEMEEVLEGANALRIKLGKELQPTVDALSESIVKGSSKALKEFGIEAKNKTELLEKLRAATASMGGTATIAGDDFAHAQVSMADAVDDLKGAFGRLVIALGPVIEGMAHVVNLSTAFLNALTSSFHPSEEWQRAFEKTHNLWQLDIDRLNETINHVKAESDVQGVIFANAQKNAIHVSQIINQDIVTTAAIVAKLLIPKTIDERLAGIRAEAERQKVLHTPTGFDRTFQGGSVEAKLPDNWADDIQKQVAKVHPTLTVGVHVDPKELIESLVDTFSGLKNLPTELGNVFQATFNQAMVDAETARHQLEFWHDLQDAIDRVRTTMGELGAEAARSKLIMETVFGRPMKVDLGLEAAKQAHLALQTLGNAAGAAVDAWITGQKSAGEAIKQAIGEGLRGLAVQAAVNALMETALGVASAAVFNFPGAAAHFQAAGLFAGVAVAAGVGASVMGAGRSAATPSASSGASASAAGSALGPSTRGAPATPAGPQQTVILVGKDLLGLPDLEQRQLIYSAIQQGKVLDVRTSTIRRG